MMSRAEVAAGAIYDIGYQRYDGPRLGRAGAIRALYVHGLRTLFGIGRGLRAKIPPVALVAFMVVPALVQAALAGLGNGAIQVFTHQGYFRTTVWLFGLFCAFQVPELVTGDRQYRVLALYFSRALRRSDYVLARLGAVITALFVVGLLPHIILLLGQYFAATDLVSAVRESAPLLPRILTATMAIAILLATVSLTIAALIRRKPFATAGILGLFLLASAFVMPLVMNQPDQLRGLVFASPMIVGDGVTTWIFETSAVRAARDSVEAAARAQAVARRRRVRRRRATVLEAAGFPGVLYLIASIGYVAIAAGVLTLRYRSVET